MGRIGQLKRITKARIEAFLDSLEQPQYILPQLIREMAAKVDEAANAEAKALTALRASQRRLDEATGRVMRLENGARAAIRAQDLDTARQAVAVLIEAEKQVEACQRQRDLTQGACQEAGAVRAQLQTSLDDLKVRSKELLARDKVARVHREVQHENDLLDLGEGQSILDAVARMEAKIEQAECEIDVHGSIARQWGLVAEAQALDQMERNAEVEQRLARLRQECGSDAGNA